MIASDRHYPSDRLRAFLAHAPSGSTKALATLSSAESLTDWLAIQLVELASKNGKLRATRFVAALHTCGFVVERNSEWHLSGDERGYLVRSLLLERRLYEAAHKKLLGIASEYTRWSSESDLPHYLTLPAAIAYHKTALDPAGSYLYGGAYSDDLGATWLGARLAEEQIEMGLIPRGAIEPSFLIGMNLYREGKRSAALQVLRPIAFSNEMRREVAISAHLYGRSLRRREPEAATSLLLKSFEILQSLDDHFGQAQVLHTLGQILWQRDSRAAEAYLRKSVEIGRDLVHPKHVSEVLHTLGQALWNSSPGEAERFLRESIEIDSALANQSGLAQVQHTLGQKLRKSKPDEATDLLRQSLATERRIGRKLGQAQVLHTLAQHILGSNSLEAEQLLRESLTIGQAIGNLRHQAIVCLTLGKLLLSDKPVEARELFSRSLQLNRASGDREGERLVLREMRSFGLLPSTPQDEAG
jgi:hypothetical protein